MRKDKVLSEIRALTESVISRTELANKMGLSFGTKRDLYQACGYPSEQDLDYTYFKSRFDRQGIATRIICAPVAATWKLSPEVYEDEDPKIETVFESTWNDLVLNKNIWSRIKRVDTLAGIGQYSVLLLGFDDGEDLSTEVAPNSNRQLLFIQPYSEDNADIEEWDTDPSSERYNLPISYSIKISRGTTYENRLVNWTRIIHIADGLLESDVYGTPRLQCVYNRLQDLETISAGSAEMFWQGAFPGIAYIMDKDADPGTQDIESMDDEIQKYIHKLRRYMKLRGVTPQQLAPNISSPKEQAQLQLQLISAGSGIPSRILVGSERGELASSQDEKNWNERINERRLDYGTCLLRSLIDRLIYTGVLPTPKDYYIYWPNIDSLRENEKATIAETRMKALATYMNAIGAQDVYPFEFFLQNELGLSQEEIELISRYVGKSFKEEEDDKVSEKDYKVSEEKEMEE